MVGRAEEGGIGQDKVTLLPMGLRHVMTAVKTATKSSDGRYDDLFAETIIRCAEHKELAT